MGPEQGTQVPQWPENESRFKTQISSFYGAAEQIALELVGHIARTLNTRPEELLRSFEDHTSYLRLEAQVTGVVLE